MQGDNPELNGPLGSFAPDGPDGPSPSPSSAPTANQVLVWLRYAPSAHACLMHTASGSALPPSHGHVGHHSSFTTVPSSTLRQGQETWQTGTASSLFHCFYPCTSRVPWHGRPTLGWAGPLQHLKVIIIGHQLSGNAVYWRSQDLLSSQIEYLHPKGALPTKGPTTGLPVPSWIHGYLSRLYGNCLLPTEGEGGLTTCAHSVTHLHRLRSRS